VPLLAMAFGIAKGFGFERRLEQQILAAFPDQQEVAVRIIQFAHSFLENTQGGLIAGVGVIVLIWTVIKVVGHIEKSFNDIWGVRKGRSWGRKFTDYLSMMLIAPVLFVTAGSATVLATVRMESLTREFAALGALSPLIFAALKLLPYGVICALFTFLYVMMPNTRVESRSALFGGVTAGAVFQVVQWAYIELQLGVSSYGAIYGSFAALPLFLVWLQTSWMIVLFGAEMSFSRQNRKLFEFGPDCTGASREFRRLAALRVAQFCARRFESRERPPFEDEIAEALDLPLCLVRDTLLDLAASGILVAVGAEEAKATAYQPAQATGNLTVLNVVRQLERNGTGPLPRAQDPEWERLSTCLEGFDRVLQDSEYNVPLNAPGEAGTMKATEEKAACPKPARRPLGPGGPRSPTRT